MERMASFKLWFCVSAIGSVLGINGSTCAGCARAGLDGARRWNRSCGAARNGCEVGVRLYRLPRQTANVTICPVVPIGRLC